MTDSQLRTVALLSGLLALVGLAALVIVSGHDSTGATLYSILQGVLTLVGVLAGAHAANGHGTTLYQSSTAGAAPQVLEGGRRSTDPHTIGGGTNV